MIRNWVPFQEAVTFRSLLLDYIAAAGGGLYWALDDTDLATDLSGNGHDGTAAGPTIGGETVVVPPIDGEDASCTDFDGTDDSITSTYAWASGNTGSRTFVCWAYRDTTTGTDAFFGVENAAGIYLQGISAGTRLRFGVDAANEGNIDGGAPGVTWKMYTASFEPATDAMKISINGVVTAHTGSPVGWDASTGNFRVGAGGAGANPLDGKMGHVAVVEGILTDQQITDLYAASGN
jgi:hypothetical protein